jgi:DNA-binding beta-propeller fold protein YncE
MTPAPSSLNTKDARSAADLRHYDLLVTSAAAAKGTIRNGVFRFDPLSGECEGEFGRGAGIGDPRGVRLSPDGRIVLVNDGDDRILKFAANNGAFLGMLAELPGLTPGGGKFGSDGRYYVGARTQKSVVALDFASEVPPVTVIASGFVKFPRGLAVAPDGAIYLASGVDPATGEGQNTILRFLPDGCLGERFNLVDPALSPLDLELGPSGSLLSASEVPFDAPDAVTTVREYDPSSGKLMRVFDAGRDTQGRRLMRHPRGITVGPDGGLYAAGADNVVRYDLETGEFERVVVHAPGMLAQSVILVPKITAARRESE